MQPAATLPFTADGCYPAAMCGRFVLYSPPAELEALFEAPLAEGLATPRYNIAPGSDILAVRLGRSGRREFACFHWGLIPSWAKDRAFGYRTINARAETIAEKPAFRAAFRQRRCLIPADGFYEWQTTPAGKQPYLIAMRDRGPFAFAGLWETWLDRTSGESIESCTIIVTEANALLRPIHDRMPVILNPEDSIDWIDSGQARVASLRALLRPFDPETMTAHPVDRRVGRPTEDGPYLIEPRPHP